jgi:hypothetical protein
MRAPFDKRRVTTSTSAGHGPVVSPGTVTIATSTGPLSYTETDKVGAKVTGYAKTTVSADGKTMTTVSWDPGKESEAATYVYENSNRAFR